MVGKYPYIFFFYYYNTHTHTHTHISFSVILVGILCAGKKHFLGNLAVRYVCRMHSTFANRHIANPSNFSRENISCLSRPVLYQVSIFYVDQTDSVLNFARGQTPADDVCILKCILKHRQKIRVTFFSLSEEKKATLACLKLLRHSCCPLAYSLLIMPLDLVL